MYRIDSRAQAVSERAAQIFHLSQRQTNLRRIHRAERLHTLEVTLPTEQLRLIPTVLPFGFEGTTNTHLPFTDSNSGNIFLLRLPTKSDLEWQSQTRHLYTAQGYMPKGANADDYYHRRTIAEQFAFMHQLADAGIPSVRPTALAKDRKSMLVPYIAGVPLDTFLQRTDVSAERKIHAVQLAFGNILNAHKHSFLMGDRWITNSIVVEQQDQMQVVEVDFDIELRGDNAREFELGKFLFHALYYASDREAMLPALMEMVQQAGWQNYNLAKVAYFIGQHHQLFLQENADPANHRQAPVAILESQIAMLINA